MIRQLMMLILLVAHSNRPRLSYTPKRLILVSLVPCLRHSPTE